MVEFITRFIEQLGYLGIALLMFAETIVPPIPSELIMPLVGVAAAEGRLGLFGAIVSATAGATMGATVWYLAARAYGADRLLALADRHGRWLRLDGAMIRGPAAWFARYGGWTLFLARILPGMRVYISIPAGLVGMRLPRFLAFTFAGFGVWYGLLGMLGYALDRHARSLVDAVAAAGPWLWAALAAVVAWRIGVARRSAKVAS